MNIYNKDEVNINKNRLFERMNRGKIFIYPTDTIYGIGCIATDDEAVRKVREIKDRHKNPFSIIAPSKDWIIKNCEINGKAKEWLDRLPGPYTLIIKLKNGGFIADSVNNSMDTIGIRIPDHWISDMVKDLGTPIITTSANRHGLNFMTSMDNLDTEIKSQVDFIIYEGEITGHPSTLVDMTGSEIKIKER